MSPAPRSAVPHKACSALVVDDDAFMLDFMREMLEELGVRNVRTAKNGDEAARALAGTSLQPDVVLCDLNMPGTDGFLFMERLGEQGFKGGVVVVSGMDSRVLNSAAVMARFHRLNILGTLGKPVQQSALAETLGRLR